MFSIYPKPQAVFTYLWPDKKHCIRAKICTIMLSMSAISLRKSTLHTLLNFLHVLHHQKSVSVQKYPYCIVCPTNISKSSLAL